jgi:hypothetical protein
MTGHEFYKLLQRINLVVWLFVIDGTIDKRYNDMVSKKWI